MIVVISYVKESPLNRDPYSLSEILLKTYQSMLLVFFLQTEKIDLQNNRYLYYMYYIKLTIKTDTIAVQSIDK